MKPVRGNYNWKRNQVLRLGEKEDEYLCRLKKTDMIPVRSLGTRCSSTKGGYQCMYFGDDKRERRSSSTCRASVGDRKEHT